jgi:hypothetical protein
MIRFIILSLAIIVTIQCTVYGNEPLLYPGFPLRIDSGFTFITPPLLADFDNDGMKEILYTTGGSAHPPRRIYVVRLDGSNYPGWPVQYAPPDYCYATAIGDIDGNGTLDIALITDKLYVYNSTGALFPNFPVAYHIPGEYLQGYMVLSDLDNDGQLEIILESGSRVLVYEHDGQLRSGWPQSVLGYVATKPCVGDLNNDGTKEIIITSVHKDTGSGISQNKINVYKQNGEMLNGWPVEMDSNYSFGGPSEPTILPHSAVGPLIIVNNNRAVLIDSMYYDIFSRISIYDSSANLVRRWRVSSENSGGNISLADFDNDGSVEIISWVFPEIIISTLNGEIIKRNMYGYLGGPNSITVGKLTTIGTYNIAAVDYNLYANDTASIFFYNFDGTPMSWSPLHTKGLAMYTPLFDDIDNDGQIEMVTITSTLHDNNYLCIWTLPGISSAKENFPWPMYGHDRYRTSQYGFVPPDEITSVPSYNQTPLQVSLSQNYPNPFNPQTAIGFSLLAVSNVLLKVYNLLGQEVATLINNEPMQPGKHEVQFDGSKLSSGIYFYRLNVDGKFSATKKLVVMK